MATTKEYNLNFGPQHPAAHGVLRLILSLEGETITNVDPNIGFLHRGVEKLAENLTYQQITPYIDRLDYISTLANEHCYILALEKLCGITPPERAQYIRVLFDEITRLLSHLIWLGSHALDIGAMSVFLYAMQEREKLLDCYEAMSGSRVHPNLYRIGGMRHDLPETMPDGTNFFNYLRDFLTELRKVLAELENMLTDNPIWKKRTIGIGVATKEQAIAHGFTGPMLRASGVNWDLRQQQPYAVYEQLQFNVPVKQAGDCYARYLVYLAEMQQSSRLIAQCTTWLENNPGPINTDNKIINIPAGEAYAAIEHPKGEFGIYINSQGENKPWRLRIRAASFPHLAAINMLAKGHMIADLAAIISSTNIILGEVDR
ncbi:MAG: NADH-quinone oxidoreductase subunit D [Gammaproteobacteria bacterium]|nr:NADH-quinone oxidoreductase subunit D [Gammaproteobacteria bacterium]